MRTHGRLLIAAVAAVAALGVSAATAAAKNVRLTIADDGAHVKVHKGDTISISLASNQTTPYHWVVTSRPKARVARVTQARSTSRAAPASPAPAGRSSYVDQAKGTGATAFATQYQEISTGAPGTGRSDFVITITVTK